ncbi:MAG: STAS domain-containing protein [Anaerolineaceae bacterium]|nr:MAG: STAS domain-containing protein [Anaerolineaceae bacterium]
MTQNTRATFDSKTLVPGLIAGLIVGIIVVTISISLGSFIFSGELAQFAPRGMGLLLFSGLVMGLTVAGLSSLPGAAIGPQDGPSALLAVAAAGVASGLAGVSNPEIAYHTVVTGVLLSTLATGAVFFFIGQFKLGNLVRYIPYPVIGGFLAGTGWLITRGTLEGMAGQSLSLAALPSLVTPDALFRWLPGALFATAVLLILRKFNHFLIWPGIVLGGISIFYGLIFLRGMTFDEARAAGQFMQPFGSGGLWQPFLPSHFADVDWAALSGALDSLAIIPLVSLIAFLLNASALELVAKRDIDLNRELRVAGLSNILAGLGGGVAGYHLLGATALAFRMGAQTRIVSLVSALVCGLVLVAGGSFISFLPVAFLNGMLLMLGLSFLVDWLYDARPKLPVADYALVWVILFVIGSVGFLEGVIAGVAISILLFVFKYANVNTVRDSLNGQMYHSKVERPAIQRETLNRLGESIHVFRLQGFIFFGTSNSILSRVREILEDQTNRENFIVLDFHRVHNLDSSAVSSFVRMRQLADLHDIYLVLTQVSPLMRRQMEQGGFVGDQRVQFFPSLDHGMEWCENMLLMKYEASTQFISTSLESQLKRSFPHPELVESLMGFLERVEAEAAQTLMRRGEASDAMYFVESGRLNIELTTPDGEVIRLRSIRSGTVIGEMGLYLHQPRTADVVTLQPSVLYRLDADALMRMEAEQPQTAAALHEWIALMLAERLSDNNRAIEALLD